MNSTIQKSKCKCAECKANPDKAKWPTLSCYGYNYAHLPDDLKEKAGTKHKVAVKNRNKRQAISRKLHIAQKQVDGGLVERISLWFKYQMSVSKKVCENCGVSLEHYNDQDWYGSQHHIVEKSLCPSVATHPQNHLVLGKWCCHGQWHSCWYNASIMAIFPKAIEKFQLFKNDIAANEMKKVNPYLTKENPYQANLNQHQQNTSQV